MKQRYHLIIMGSFSLLSCFSSYADSLIEDQQDLLRSYCLKRYLDSRLNELDDEPNTTGALRTYTFSPSGVSLDFQSILGKVLVVDSVYGNDSRASRNGPPFLTITAALAAAQPDDCVWIMPGTYAESITIPAGVDVRGISTSSVNIARTVSSDTDLVTMGENSRLTEVTLQLTSSSHVQLRGIVFPGTTSSTARVVSILLTVDNSTAGAGTSNVYGVHSMGTGIAPEERSALRAALVTVSSAGLGVKRGILIDTPNDFHIRDAVIAVSNATGAGSYIGVETNATGAAFTTRTSTIAGPTADISQTFGVMTIVTTDSLNANANGLGFNTRISPTQLVWADVGQLPAGTNFMHIGTDTPANEMFIRASQPTLVKGLSVRARLAPGAGIIDTWTLRKDGVDTSFQVSLTGSNFSGFNGAQSVSFATGASISLKIVRGAGSSTSEPTVVMDLY